MKSLKYFIFTLITCFISLSVVKADAVCVYEFGDYKITCTASNNNVGCTNQSVGDIKFNFSSMSLTYNAFLSGDKLKCPSNLYVSLSGPEGAITDISSVNKTNTLSLSNNASLSKVDNSDINNNSYENDPEYIAAKKDADEYCDSTNFTTQDDAKCEEARNRMNSIKNKYVTGSTSSSDGKFDYENPCSDRVLGVFTTVGWIFFIAKILIPIILIVMGSIDFGKAIMAAKEDEIIKSAKTLVMRAIAGIIIFFIPTLLNFVINIMGNNADDVYNNQFSNCTKCMFKPNQSGCTSLGGK